MILQVVVLLSTFILNFVGADRNIIPSIGATLHKIWLIWKQFLIFFFVFLLPAVCGRLPNEEFAIDLSRCQNTCEYYGRTWDCPISYKPNGDCYCKPGFARIADDGKCVSVINNVTCLTRLPITRGMWFPANLLTLISDKHFGNWNRIMQWTKRNIYRLSGNECLRQELSHIWL